MHSEFISIPWKPWPELAPTTKAENTPATALKKPSYGRYLEDFIPGQVFVHPRGITFHEALCQDFATTFMESCPLFLNSTYPKSLGFTDRPVPPLLVLASTLSLGVQNESEKAIAHLGYYDACFPRVTRVGETLRALTRVVDRKVRGDGEPGIVHVQTLGLNDQNEICVRYERKIMIPSRKNTDASKNSQSQPQPCPQNQIQFPWPDQPILCLPKTVSQVLPGWTAGATFFDDFSVGDVILHFNGRTITDEHFGWTYRLGNTHPLHYDSVYTHALPAPMGGKPVVYGGLVFSWIAGLASRDTTENMIWDLGYTQGYHTQPTRAGDTVYAISRILAKEEGPLPASGVLTIQLIGLKNITADQAYSKFGHTLFLKENDKKKMGLEKISEKIFEIERKILVRKL